ncbi:hypothetical protein D3C73_1157660 [compost metagenome]
MCVTERVHQTPSHQSFHPLTLFRQEGALAGTQPAFAILFTNADVQIGWADIHISHDQHRIVALQFSLQIVLQVLIKRGFGWELQRVVTAFALRKIAVNHGDIPQWRRDFGHDNTALSFFVIVREATTHRNGRFFRQQRDAVMAFLTVIENVVTQLCDLFEREHVIVDFCLLQADHIRLVFFDNGCQLMRTGTQAVDIKRDKFHSRCHFAR